MNDDFPNLLISLYNGDEDLKLLFEMLRNVRLLRGGKSEGKVPFKVLFERFKEESEVRWEMGFMFPLMLQFERSRWLSFVRF